MLENITYLVYKWLEPADRLLVIVRNGREGPRRDQDHYVVVLRVPTDAGATDGLRILQLLGHDSSGDVQFGQGSDKDPLFDNLHDAG